MAVDDTDAGSAATHLCPRAQVLANPAWGSSAGMAPRPLSSQMQNRDELERRSALVAPLPAAETGPIHCLPGMGGDGAPKRRYKEDGRVTSVPTYRLAQEPRTC